MKQALIYLLLTLLALSFVGCKEHSDYDSLTDGEKLEMLNIRIQKHPKDAEAIAERASVLLRLGRTNEAVFDMARAVELEPKNASYRLRQADICFAGGDVESSYKALTEAEKLDPKSIEIQLKMGEVTFYSHDYDRSLKCLSNVTEKEPNNRTALFMKGYIYKEKGDTANAVGLIKKVCNLYPDYEPAFEELGNLYATRSDPMAVEYLTTAMRLEPNNTNAIYALAMYYQGIGQLDEAEALYHNMLDINENSADAWHNLGYIEMLYYKDYARAIEYFDKALLIDPDMKQAIINKQVAEEALK